MEVLKHFHCKLLVHVLAKEVFHHGITDRACEKAELISLCFVILKFEVENVMSTNLTILLGFIYVCIGC